MRQLKRRLDGKPLEPFVYRDFGSLVSFGRLGAIGNLMGLLLGKGLFIEGALARLMYRSLYKMHETALHGRLENTDRQLDAWPFARPRRAESQAALTLRGAQAR